MKKAAVVVTIVLIAGGVAAIRELKAISEGVPDLSGMDPEVFGLLLGQRYERKTLDVGRVTVVQIDKTACCTHTVRYSVMDPKEGTLLTNLRGYAISPDQTTVLADASDSQGKLLIVDATTATVRGSVPLSGWPRLDGAEWTAGRVSFEIVEGTLSRRVQVDLLDCRVRD